MEMSSLPTPKSNARANRPDAPVLVFGSDTNAFLGTVRSLGRKGLEVHAAGCEENMPACSSRYISRSHAIPSYEGDGSAWVARVGELKAEFGFGLLVPTSDASLAQLAAHRDTLGNDRIAVPSNEALDLFANKWATREASRELGIPVPEARLIDGSTTAAKIAEELGLPAIVKSCRSYTVGDRVQKTAVALVETATELQEAMDRAQDAMVEGFIPGFCKGVSVLAHKGEVLQAFQHKRLRQEHATGPSSWRVSEALDSRLLEAARKLIAHSDYTGVAMFEFRFDIEGKDFVLLEVNPRFWGSMQLASDAGADYGAALHGMLVDEVMPEKRLEFPAGLQKRSVWGEFDALSQSWASARGASGKMAALVRMTAFLVALALKHGFDSYAADDPEPFHRERAQVLGRFAAQITGREALGGRLAGRDL